MGKYSFFGDENVLDFVNNKCGRRFNIPKFGEKLDVVGVRGIKPPALQKFRIKEIQNLDYLYTFIEYNNPRTIKGIRIMTSVKKVKGYIKPSVCASKHGGISVYYRDKSGRYSEIVPLRG